VNPVWVQKWSVAVLNNDANPRREHMTQLSDNRRIAKNTVFLYLRMLLIMAVNLFAVRIVLRALGPVDYGINNVVGGVVIMFSLLTGTMVSASQRFFAFELGRENQERLSQLFSLTLLCYATAALFIVVGAETVGIWFLKTKLDIPESRQIAAFWVFQFSIISFTAKLFAIPYNSIIIAREQMNVYAFVSVFEALSKLLIVYLLYISSVDKLILYAVLICVVTVVVSLIYVIYCRSKYPECKFKWFWNREMFQELLSYSGWNLFGAGSAVLGNQGINILLNIFFGPAVNAARAIAYQISSAMNQFVMNFFKAVQPQITKLHAVDRNSEMLDLVFVSSRFCFYMMLLLSLPVLLETGYLLTMWLDHVPEYVLLFTRLVIITALIESISYAYMAAIQATGKIRLYQAVTGGLLLLTLPVSYGFLKWGFPPQITMYVAMTTALSAQISRVVFMNRLVGMSIAKYMSNVVCRIAIVSLATTLPCCLLSSLFDEGLLRVFVSVVCVVTFGGLSVYFLGISGRERKAVSRLLMSQFRRLTKTFA